jgi:hypothetical protein
MSMLRNTVMGLMLASSLFAVGCNKSADQDAGASNESTAITAAAPVQAKATTTVASTPSTTTATVNASLGTTQYHASSYNNAAYQRGVRNGERLEAEKIRFRDPGFYRNNQPVVVNRPVVIEEPIRRPVVIERPGFFVRFANWRHTHGCRF